MMIDDLIADLRRDEGLRLKPYRCTAGRLTIGYGRNLDDAGITAEEAEFLLRNDVRRVSAELDRDMPWWRDLSPGRQRALANMAVNLGLPRLKEFRLMLSALRRGDYEEAARQALDSRWARQVGDRARRIAGFLGPV
jgi:lysozyme